MEKKRNVWNKGGLSPVIASVLMILLVLVLSVIIFLWARGFVDEQVEKFGKPIEEMCESVDFMVEEFEDELEIVNRGNVDIHHLDVKMSKGGNSEVSKFDFRIDSGKAVREPVSFRFVDGSIADEVIVYPALIGKVKDRNSNKIFTCMNAGKVL
jgi:FlaG/FlaF family flagellin (archaellin)